MYQIHRIGGYLLPLPVAILLLIAGSSYTLRLRFDLSEEALHDRVQRFERGDTVSPGGSELVGLYTVESIYHRIVSCLKRTVASTWQVDLHTALTDRPQETSSEASI